MERSVAAVFERWLSPGCSVPGSGGDEAGACGRPLGTGHDDGVARVLRALQDDEPRDYDAYLRNVRDIHRVAEADLAIAAARSAHYRGVLAHGRGGTSVRLYSTGGERAGEVAIRFDLAELDPEKQGEARTWRVSARVPEALAEEMARLAPSWVLVQREAEDGALSTLRAPIRRRPPSRWTSRLPPLRMPPMLGCSR